METEDAIALTVKKVIFTHILPTCPGGTKVDGMVYYCGKE